MNEQIKPGEVVIVGNGVAALSLARNLSKVAGIPSTLIAPYAPELTGDALPMRSRTSTPGVKESILRALDIPFDHYQKIQRRNILVGKPINGLQRLVLRLMDWHQNTLEFGGNPPYLLDTDRTRRELFADAASDPNITVVQGKFTDLELEDGKITKVVINDGEMTLEPRVVFDATGRQARVAEKVNEKRRGSVETKVLQQPSMLIGGFIRVDGTLLDKYPFLNNESQVGVLPGGVTAIVAPVQQVPESEATHGFLIEGNSTAITRAFREAEKQVGNASREAKFMRAFELLTQGTWFEEVLGHTASVDRTIFYPFKAAVRNEIQDHNLNLALVGDAQILVNAISGKGFTNIARDVNFLLQYLAETSTIEEGVAIYNRRSNRHGKRKMAEAEFSYLTLKALFRFFNTGDLS